MPAQPNSTLGTQIDPDEQVGERNARGYPALLLTPPGKRPHIDVADLAYPALSEKNCARAGTFLWHGQAIAASGQGLRRSRHHRPRAADSSGSEPAGTGRGDGPTLAKAPEEFGAWLCWPGLSGACYAPELRPWFSTCALNLINASSLAELRIRLRDFDDRDTRPATPRARHPICRNCRGRFPDRPAVGCQTAAGVPDHPGADDCPNAQETTERETAMVTEDEQERAVVTDYKFWTVAEVAALLRVSKMSVYRLVHNGDLESIRVGRSIRIPEEIVSTYIEITPTPGRPTR